MDEIIHELNSITDYRRRFFIIVHISNVNFRINLKLLHIVDIVSLGDVIRVNYNQKLFEFSREGLVIDYTDNTPILKEDKKRRRFLRR